MPKENKVKSYLLKDGVLGDDDITAQGQRFRILPFTELGKVARILEEKEEMIEKCLRKGVSSYEAHDRFDYLSISLIDTGDLLEKPSQLCAYFSHDELVVVTDGCKILDSIIYDLYAEKNHCDNLIHILYLLLERLTEFDYQVLEDLEEELSELEESLFTEQKKDYIREIIIFRKRLMTLKRYYERLLYVCDEVEENGNGLVGKHTLHGFHSMYSRISRLGNGVHDLQEYATQVREAYQAQVDISLNQIMKIFTVITSIFLPLTLIAGWYGMNLAMPEFGWAYAYPCVIGLCIAVVVLFVLYFKKKNWF